jgi:hypothetical protein
MLSMVDTHYPLINFTRFEKDYPKEVGVQEAGELRGQLSELAATIIGDINLCRNINATVARDDHDVCSGIFKPTTWGCGLNQLVLGRAICKQGAAGACGHDQPGSCDSDSINRGSTTAVDWR